MHSALLADYMQHLRRRNLADRTRESHLSRLRLYCRTLDPFTVDAGQIEDFLDHRRLSPRARLDWVGCLVGFHRWLMDGGWRPDDPTMKVVRPKLPGRLPRPIADADLRLAFEAARGDHRMTCWLALGAYAGLRVHEMAALTWGNVDWEAQLLRVQVAKGSKPRVVPMADALVKALEVWDREMRARGGTGRGYVFPALLGGVKPTGHPMSRITITNLVSRFLHDLRIDATAHQLRHWFGTETYRRTKDIRLVSELLGHSDLRTTALYVKLIPSEAAVEVVRNLTA